jgi:hypothetical protein
MYATGDILYIRSSLPHVHPNFTHICTCVHVHMILYNAFLCQPFLSSPRVRPLQSRSNMSLIRSATRIQCDLSVGVTDYIGVLQPPPAARRAIGASAVVRRVGPARLRRRAPPSRARCVRSASDRRQVASARLQGAACISAGNVGTWEWFVRGWDGWAVVGVGSVARGGRMLGLGIALGARNSTHKHYVL